MELAAPVRRRLEGVLELARDRGALGPGPVGAHVEHSLGLAKIAGHFPTTFVDLGSGGGVPGLVLATVWPDAPAVLVDSMAKRCAFLREAIETLDLPNCSVVEGRAEEIARMPEHRERYDLVAARSFAPPSVTAECAAPLLAVGGCLLVAEPPEGDPARWPAEGLLELGFGPANLQRAGQVTGALIAKVEPTGERFPRRAPAKRPLW